MRRAVSLAVAAVAAVAAAPAAANWPIYGRDLANTRNAGADGPSLAQIPTLKQAWKFDSPTGDFTGTPVVAAGVVVAGDYSGTVYALDAVTGKVRWKHRLSGPVDGSAAVDVRKGAVYVPVATVGAPRLVSLSLRGGARRWSTVLTHQAGSSVYGSPTFWRGTVYIGTSGPNGDGSTARGTVVALDEGSGAVRWRTFTVPPGHDGGPVWSTPAIDTRSGRLYVGAGNAYHPPAAATTDAILSLDARTGALLGHYQAIPGDVFGPDGASGPDADFGASPNLFRAPDGRRLVGEGAKDGNYYALDRATMKSVWTRALGPGSAIGGFVGSTAFDGQRVYGSNALTSQVGAIARDGSPSWTSADGGSLDFSPLAMANGVLYSLNQSGVLTARHAQTGTVLTKVPLGAPSFGGIATTGGAVYVAIGLGPPPPPAPQQYGNGSIVALGDTSRSGPGGRATLRVLVEPREVRAGERTSFRFRVSSRSGAPVAGAGIHFADQFTRTDANGRATVSARFAHAGRRHARVSAPGYESRTVTVTVRARQHGDGADSG
jgi:polyvinyl alcohol dehydrogenase (cytochrome)